MSLINICNRDIEEFNKKYSCSVKQLDNDEPQVLNTGLLKIFSGIYVGEMSNEIIMADSCNRTLIVSVESIRENADKTLSVDYDARWSGSGDKPQVENITGSVSVSAVDFGILLLDQINNNRYTFKDTILKKRIYEDILKKTKSIDNMIQVYRKGDKNKTKLILVRKHDDKVQEIVLVSNSFIASSSHEYMIYGAQIDSEVMSKNACEDNSLYIVDGNNLLLAFSPFDVAVAAESSTIRITFPYLLQLAGAEETKEYDDDIKPLIMDYERNKNNTLKEKFYENMFDW